MNSTSIVSCYRVGSRTVTSLMLCGLAMHGAGCGGGMRRPVQSSAPVLGRVISSTDGSPASNITATAVAGDTLYIVEHYVLASKRTQFERFVQESYWPALRLVAQTDSSIARVLRHTRIVYPVRANDDGTFSYMFLMDPAVPGETYNILALLHRAYSPADTERRYRELTESWARPLRGFQSRAYVQPAVR